LVQAIITALHISLNDGINFWHPENMFEHHQTAVIHLYGIMLIRKKSSKEKKRLAYNKPEQSSSNSEGTFPPTRIPSVIVYRAGGGLGEA
jgi:hypothetical protein